MVMAVTDTIVMYKGRFCLFHARMTVRPEGSNKQGSFGTLVHLLTACAEAQLTFFFYLKSVMTFSITAVSVLLASSSGSIM
jgi:hypothetical protein